MFSPDTMPWNCEQPRSLPASKPSMIRRFKSRHTPSSCPANGLHYRVREFLSRLDRMLADFRAEIRQDSCVDREAQFRILPDLVRGRRLPPKARVRILVMDGMRYDTWDMVVRPLLAEHFEVVDGKDRPYFSLLPSKTDVARRGLLAANLGKDWKDYFGKPAKAERTLARRGAGTRQRGLVGANRLHYRCRDDEARQKMGYNVEEGCDFNVLIYPISDDLGHYHNDTLSALNDKIRQQLLSQQGRRGIIDDLKRRVQPGDLVLVTSDHGFQELFPDEAATISRLDAIQSGAKEEDIAYRYLRFNPKKASLPADCVAMEWEEIGPGGRHDKTSYVLPVGWPMVSAGRRACRAIRARRHFSRRNGDTGHFAQTDRTEGRAGGVCRADDRP